MKKLIEMIFCRVIGAIVVVAGLYLVVWGKSKDHKLSSPKIDEQISPAEQTKDAGSNATENFGHDVMKIDV